MSAAKRSGDARGKAFEVRVADAYRSLGYQVTPNEQLPGKQTDIVARKRVQGGPLLSLAIECKDEASPIGNTQVLEFIHRVITHVSAALITDGVMVSSSGFTPDARAAASGHSQVQLLSWEQLESEVLDVRHGLGELVDAYENSSIYHDYLSLQIESLSWSTLDSSLEPSLSLAEVVLRFVRASGRQMEPNILVVLADFGAGKTTLMRHVQYERAKAYLAGRDERVPLFVQLRDFRQTQDVTTLLRGAFRDAYFVDPPVDLLWRRIRQGKFYLLLDAFDEMVERSDSGRRLDLFHQLLDVMRSGSPTMLSSRPSYFVERGELDELLVALQDHEAQISGALPNTGGASTVADRLRRRLVAANRESRPASSQPGLTNAQVKVIRLLPLDRAHIERFVNGKRAELDRAGATPEEVMAFIERTYDLSDLASRPLLLKLIVESVLDGSIDLDDGGTQLGASGLYEIYTRTKLDLDQDKRGLRRGDLSLEARRMLAEHAAIEMYEENALEVGFEEVLTKAATDGGPIAEELASSELSGAEIATDFATCSFVTLEQDGNCRFIHKSFRGFFVARVLKEELANPGTLLRHRLEREVLYFLGGFAPTESKVGNDLWTAFKHSENSERALRRNLLVAHLYTTPEHQAHVIEDGEISDADFGRLRFRKTGMKRTNWNHVTLKLLELEDVKWRDVSINNCHIIELTTRGGSVELELEEAVVESLHSDDSVLELNAAHSSIGRADVHGSSLHLTGTNVEIGDLRLSMCDMTVLGGDPSFGSIEADNCQLKLGNTTPQSGLRGIESFVSCAGTQAGVADWQLTNCVVLLAGSPDSGGRSWKLPSAGWETKGARNTIVLAMSGVEPHLLESLPAGVFGKLASAFDKGVLNRLPRAWGVLNVEHALTQAGLALPTPGLRFGDLILVGEKRYRELVRKQGGLSAVAHLHAMAEISLRGESTGPSWWEELARAREEAKAQYKELLGEQWHAFEP